MNRNFLDRVSCIGADLIKNGAEVSRAEDSMKRMLTSCGCENFTVFCVSSFVIVYADGNVVMKRIINNSLDLSEIDRLNTLSRRICQNTNYLDSNQDGCEQYPLVIRLIAIVLATGSFCIYFGGNIFDSLVAGLIGIVISCIPRLSNSTFAGIFGQSVIAGILSYVPLLLGFSVHPAKIMIGTIMLLIPGITIGSSIRDIMYSDTISGLIEFTESVFFALAIAFGFSVAVLLLGD